MKPRPRPQESGSQELFRSKLKNIINMRHELVRLGDLIDWARLEKHFAPYYKQAGRPGLPIRLVVGLHLLKHIEGLSDEAVCERWERDPYMQHFSTTNPRRAAQDGRCSSFTRRNDEKAGERAGPRLAYRPPEARGRRVSLFVACYGSGVHQQRKSTSAVRVWLQSFDRYQSASCQGWALHPACPGTAWQSL